MAQNIAGENVILGADYARDREAFIAEMAERYALTPVFDPAVIPAGRAAHIGNGVFYRHCSGCEDFALTYGTPFIMAIAQHEASHGGLVAGYNSPLLP